VRNGETKHLCDDECFKTFRARPTDFLQSTSARHTTAATETDTQTVGGKVSQDSDEQVVADECSQCNKATAAEVLAANTSQFNGASHQFCGADCMTAFRTLHERDVPCEWCTAVKSNFDMKELMDSGYPTKFFCTLECLSLFRVNQQANSGQSVPCDQCHKLRPAKYHLTMSDASVRNFCDYPCVAAFQTQFSSPATAATSSVPTPGQKVTANNANSAPPAATSKYGTRSRGKLFMLAFFVKKD